MSARDSSRADRPGGARASAPGASETGARRARWRLRAPLAVALSRLRARPGRVSLVVMGVAASCAMLVGVLGGSLAAQDRTLQQTLASLPSSERTLRIDAFGLAYGQSFASADRTARAALARLTKQPPFVVTSFTTLIIAGEEVRLAGIDGLPRIGRLVSGRWPRECRPERCEVVQVGRVGRRVLSQSGIHLVRVGIAELPDRSEFGESLTTSSPVAQHVKPVLLLTDGADSFERLSAFEGLYRNYSWIAPLDPRAIQIWQVATILARESAVAAVLAQTADTWSLTGPDAALQGAQAEASVAGRRMVLVGGEISALLLGFAYVAAVGLRRGISNEARRLSQRGARRLQVRLAVSAEAVAMTLGGALAGLCGGVVAVVVTARAAGLPVGALLGHSLGSAEAVGVVFGVWLVASLVIVAAVSMRERRAVRGVRVVDVAALGAAVAVALGLSSGSATAANLSSDDRLLFSLLPALVCFAAAVLAGRLLGPLMRLAERASRGAPAAAHLAFLALARAPARTVATAGFLIVSVGLALFAVSYRATLADGARDEASYAVPLDFTLTEGAQLVLPLDAAPLRRYDGLAPGVRAYPILRRSASVAGSGTAVLSPTVLGVPAAALAELHWRSDFSALSPRSISQRVGADGPAALRGVRLPRGTRALTMSVRSRGVPVSFVLVAESGSGHLVMLNLGEGRPGSSTLSVRLPRSGSLRSVIGLEVSQQALDAFGSAHRSAEGQIGIIPAGAATLGPLSATLGGGRRSPVTDWSGWLARGGARLDPGSAPRLSYAFTQGQTFFVRLPQVTDHTPLLVLVSQNIAAAAPPGGRITLDFQDAQLEAQIVGIATRFPASEDLGSGFVVADESRLATALSAEAPGTATPDELWLSTPAAVARRVESELQRSPYAALELASRRDLEGALASEPLARGITLTLTAAGLVALVLAAVGFWVTLLSDARDERGELFDLEAQGVPPRTLRNELRARSAALLGFGMAGGLALGLILARLVVSVVSVSAETTVPNPPLLYQPGWSTALLALASLAVLAAALTELTVRNALKGRTPARASWSLE